MSLLMDALRKAEEAKRKAAQEAETDETAAADAAQKQQADTPAVGVSQEPAAKEIELSMEEKEEVSTRTAVSNLDAAIEFEDEEDYVLPSSLGGEQTDAGAGDQPETVAEQAVDEFATSDDQESPEVHEEEALDRPVEPAEEPEPFAFDDLQNEKESLDEETGATEPELAPPEPELVAPEPAQAAPLEVSSSRVIISRANNTTRPSGRSESGRRTAQNVFAAKRMPALSRRNIQLAAGGGLFLLLIAIGSYFYISLNQESTFNIPAGSYVASEFVDDGFAEESEDLIEVGTEPSADEIEPTPEDDLLAAPPLEEILAAAEFPELTEEVEPPGAAANLVPETIAEEEPELDEIATTIGDTPEPNLSSPAQVAETRASTGEPVQSAASTEPTNLISFRREASVPVLDPNLQRAYAAYQGGSLDEAEVLYRRVLASDPLQRDALLGLATIVGRSGGSAEALELYSRLLARNPRDPIARAGMMEIVPAGSPASQEADLKRLLAEFPNVAPLAYAHGNFLASNQRWSEAQQAYFRALQLAKAEAAVGGQVNPDYAFNLAVSLEHLNQRRPAQNYYREALEFAASHPAGFDLAALRNRLANMTGSDGDD